MKKREKKRQMTKAQKRKKIAVLVMIGVILFGVGLNPMLVIVEATNAISESQKGEATNLDSGNSAEELHEGVKEGEVEELSESESKKEQEATEDQEVNKDVVIDEVEGKASVVGQWGTSPWSFDETRGVLTIEAGELTGYTESPWNRTDTLKVNSEAIKEIVLTGEVVAPIDSSYLFSGKNSGGQLRNVKSITNLNQLNTNNVKSLRSMFSYALKLNNLDVSGWDTSQVTDMAYMFSYTNDLSKLDVSGWDTSQVIDMTAMFSYAMNLTELDISRFNTSKVIDMTSIFSGVQLKRLNLGEDFRFKSGGSLTAPIAQVETDILTGNWIREDEKSKGYSPVDFMANYGTGDLTAGTYVAETKENQLLWGTSPWSFDEESGVLSIEAGELSGYADSPWNREDGFKVAGSAIKKIVLTGEVIAPRDSSYLFSSVLTGNRLTNVSSITNLKQLDTKQATNMRYMFAGVSSVTELDVGKLDTSQVTTMLCMFAGVSSVTELDVGGFDTRQVKTMNAMFSGVSSATTLDVRGFDTSQVTDMKSLFSGVSSVKELDIGGFDTSQVKNMQSMFGGASSVKELDVSGFDTNQVTTMNNMFSGVSSVKELDVSGFETRKVTNMQSMFGGVSSVKELDVSGFDTSQVTTMNNMFSGVSSVKELDVGGFNTSQVTTMNNMFSGVSSVKELDVGGFDTSQVTNMQSMFKGVSSVTTLDVTRFDTSQVTDMQSMFKGVSGVTELDLGRFDTSQVTTMERMFEGSNVFELDLSNFDTKNVTDMSLMFYHNVMLKKVKFSELFDTSNVENMRRMFSGVSSLKELDISNFNVSKVTDMIDMFAYMRLEKLTLGDSFKFMGIGAALGSPVQVSDVEEPLTGNWIREDGQSIGYASKDFMLNYGTGDLTAGTYVAEIIEDIRFNEVPETLDFNDSKLSNKTMEIQRKEADWKIVVQDTRKVKTDWRVTAQLATPFQNSKGDKLTDILQYRKASQEDQVIGTTDAVTVFNGGGTGSSLIDVQWNEGEGPYLKVAPGTAKLGRYECEIQWTLIDAPI